MYGLHASNRIRNTVACLCPRSQSVQGPMTAIFSSLDAHHLLTLFRPDDRIGSVEVAIG